METVRIYGQEFQVRQGTRADLSVAIPALEELERMGVDVLAGIAAESAPDPDVALMTWCNSIALVDDRLRVFFRACCITPREFDIISFLDGAPDDVYSGAVGELMPVLAFFYSRRSGLTNDMLPAFLDQARKLAEKVLAEEAGEESPDGENDSNGTSSNGESAPEAGGS